MSAFVRGTCVFAIASIATVLSGRTFAQSDSPGVSAVDAPQATVTNAAQDAEEVTVRGRRKTLGQYRVELQEAKEELIAVYNEQNSGTDNDVTCRNEVATGTRMPQRVCRSNAQTTTEAAASREWLRELALGPRSTSGPSASAAGAAASATADAVAASSRSSAEIEKELKQLARENRTLYRAVVEYIEAEDTYLKARDEITARGTGE
jgi:molybdopterin converting factor small subunit